MAMKKRVSTEELRKTTEQMKAKKKVKITGKASSTPQVSGSMIKSQPKTTTKPKAPAILKTLPRTPSNGVKTLMPKISGAKPSVKTPMPKKAGAPASTRKPMSKSGITVVMPNGSTVGIKDIGKVTPTPKPKPKSTSTKMTPQDAAMKKIIKKRYGW